MIIILKSTFKYFSKSKSSLRRAQFSLVKMAQRISTLVAVLSIFVVSSAAVKCPGTAKYTLTFRVTWTMANHPNTALPSNAHFSPLIGCSHNSDYIMWRRGMLATPGVKLVAERG